MRFQSKGVVEKNGLDDQVKQKGKWFVYIEASNPSGKKDKKIENEE